jgi:hypothetical protein
MTPDPEKPKRKFQFRVKTENFLKEKRGFIQNLLGWYTSPTVPTIRFTAKAGVPCFELGKRARLRENSIVDSVSAQGWEIPEGCEPVLIKSGDQAELGYLTHPAGVCLSIKPEVKLQAVDDEGNPVKDKWLLGSYCGTIGRYADIDDYNQSIEREKSGGWILPLIIGIILGVMIFAPLFALLMSLAGG